MRSVNILVVEDNSIVGKDIQKRLSGMGYAVPQVVASGDSALEATEKQKPDLVLMDIMLKGSMDGMEAAEIITSKYDVPVVYLTAYSDDSTLHRAKVTGAFGYLLKPFNETELHTTIEVALYKHQMERRLRESEQWLSTTINSIADAVITTDESGTIISLNAVAERMLAIPANDAVGTRVQDTLELVLEDSGTIIPDPVGHVLHRAKPGNGTLLLRGTHGEEIPVRDQSAIMHDKAGATRGVVFVFHDITEERQAEAEILRLNHELCGRVAELTLLNKELSTFNYSVSHDLRSPLIAIDGFGQVVEQQLAEGSHASIVPHVATIRKNAREMLKTIDDLLLYTRLSKSQIEKESLDMRQLAIAAFEDARLPYGAVSVEFTVADLPPAVADRSMMRQVLINLLSNSLKFRREHEALVINVEAESEKQEVRYSVADNGIGFHMYDVHRLFTVFGRLHGSGHHAGAGLGLAIVHRIIERHGGKVWASGKPGCGATFSFTLPLQETSVNGRP